MRKIETLMNQAISSGQNFSRDNTTVVTQDGISTVYLHGNKIAEVGGTWVILWDGGWRTNTTKSRLNAILSEHGNGERVFQNNKKWFIRMNDGLNVPFVSGMVLK